MSRRYTNNITFTRIYPLTQISVLISASASLAVEQKTLRVFGNGLTKIATSSFFACLGSSEWASQHLQSISRVSSVKTGGSPPMFSLALRDRTGRQSL